MTTLDNSLQQVLQQGTSPLTSFCVDTLEKRGKTLDPYDRYQFNKLAVDGFRLEQALNKSEIQFLHYNKMCQKLEKVQFLILDYVMIIDLLIGCGLKANDPEIVTMNGIQQFVNRYYFLLAAITCSVQLVYRQ